MYIHHINSIRLVNRLATRTTNGHEFNPTHCWPYVTSCLVPQPNSVNGQVNQGSGLYIIIGLSLSVLLQWALAVPRRTHINVRTCQLSGIPRVITRCDSVHPAAIAKRLQTLGLPLHEPRPYPRAAPHPGIHRYMWQYGQSLALGPRPHVAEPRQLSQRSKGWPPTGQSQPWYG